MKKEALIICEGHSNNFGDQAIKESMYHLFNLNGYTPFFEDLTRSTNKTDNSYIIPQPKKRKKTRLDNLKTRMWLVFWTIKNLSRIIKASQKKYNIIAIGGGQLLMPNGIFPFVLFAWTTLLRLFGNRNIILFGVGLQGNYNYISSLLIKFVLKRCKLIYVRDDLSKSVLEKKFSIRTHFTYDVVFTYERNLNNEQLIEPESFKTLIGIVDYSIFRKHNPQCSKNINSLQDYYETWINITGSIDQLKKSVLIYSTTEDRRESIRFKKYLLENYKLDIEIIENFTLDNFVLNLNKGGRIISGRMHTLILGLTLNKDIIAFPLSKKIENFNLLYKDNFDLNKIKESIHFKFRQALNQLS